MRTRLKVCCIQNIDEAQLAIANGADAIGLVSAMPSGPGPIPEECIAEIAAFTPPAIATFLLTCVQTLTELRAQVIRCRCNTLQLCDAVDARICAALRSEFPALRLVQVIHVVDMHALQHARAAAEHVHAILLDSGRPQAKVKELGGTGRTHDWDISRAIVQASGVPVFLAGGLNALNVANAVAAAQPFAVDVCSGVRSQDRLDAGKLEQFTRALVGAQRP